MKSLFLTYMLGNLGQQVTTNACLRTDGTGKDLLYSGPYPLRQPEC